MGSKKPEVQSPFDLAEEMEKAGLGPQRFRSVIPEESYERINKYNQYLAERLNDARQRMYARVGTPAEIGARAAGRESLTNLAYGSSLPLGDEYSKSTFLGGGGTGTPSSFSSGDPYSEIRARSQALSDLAWQDAARKQAEAAVEPPPVTAPDLGSFKPVDPYESKVQSIGMQRKKRQRQRWREEADERGIRFADVKQEKMRERNQRRRRRNR